MRLGSGRQGEYNRAQEASGGYVVAEGAGKLILVTGGARSGKSALAQKFAIAMGGRVTYLATATVTDAEMAERIARHRASRHAHWETVEEPLAVPAVLRGLAGRTDVVLLDCLTVWLANLLLGPDGHGGDPASAAAAEDEVLASVEELAAVARDSSFTTIIVTNEVGCGVVPAYPLGRLYRDVAGLANQIVARAADEVWLTVAGIPLRLK